MQTLIKKISIFLEMIKFEHSIFALPFAYLGLFLAARGWPGTSTFLWITLAMVSCRTTGMAFNRIADRHIDSKNPRTQNRALPKKLLNTKWVSFVTLFSLGVFLFSAYKLGPLCFKLAPVPILLSAFYSYMKRFTWLCHFVLGTILGIAPYGAWIAVQGEFSWIPGFIMLGVMTWVAGFDIIYAMQDYEFDKESGLFSFPVRFGKEASLKTTMVLHAFTLVAWACAGFFANLGFIYFIGLIFVTGFLIREHWLIRSFALEKVQEAFFTMNAIVSIAVFVATVADFTLGGLK